MLKAGSLSLQGEIAQKNNDNIYLNGTFMDKFSFTKYEKSLSDLPEPSLFMLSSGHTEDKSAKQLFGLIRDLSEDRLFDSAEELFNSTLMALVEFNDSYMKPAGLMMDLAVVVVDRSHIYSLTLGDVEILHADVDKITKISDDNRDLPLGVVSVDQLSRLKNITRLSSTGRILVFKRSIYAAVGQEIVNTVADADSAEKSMAMLERSLSMVKYLNPCSAICIEHGGTKDKSGKWQFKFLNIVIVLVLLCLAVAIYYTLNGGIGDL